MVVKQDCDYLQAVDCNQRLHRVQKALAVPGAELIIFDDVHNDRDDQHCREKPEVLVGVLGPSDEIGGIPFVF